MFVVIPDEGTRVQEIAREGWVLIWLVYQSAGFAASCAAAAQLRP